MAVPVWVTDANLGIVYERSNLLIQLETSDPNDTFSIVSSQTWLSVSSLGVLQGTVPRVEITTNETIVIRATSNTLDTADRTFLLIVQPTDESRQISWNPSNLGGGVAGTNVVLNANIENLDAIEGSAAIFGRSTRTFDFNGSVLPIEWTFTRSSTATYVDGFGFLKTATTDVPRPHFEKVGSSFLRKGFMIEEERTNILTYSENFTEASWNKLSGGTGVAPVITSNYGTAPDNTFTATRVVFDRGAGTTSADISYLTQTGSGTNGAVGSIWVKSLSGTTNITVRTGATFNFSQTITSEWTRISLSGDSARFDLLAYGDQQSQVTDILIWGAQLEVGSTMSSYIPTTSTPETRTADVYTLPLYDIDYDVNVNDKDGTTSSTVSVSGGTYTLVARPNSDHVTSVVIDDYHQDILIDGTNIRVHNDGTISGNYPAAAGIYEFDMFAVYLGQVFLTPATFSLETTAANNGGVDLIVPVLFDEGTRETWANVSQQIIEPYIYRRYDPNFGIRQDISIEMGFNVSKSRLSANFSKLTEKLPVKVVISDIGYYSTDSYDVIYYDVFDDNSIIEEFEFKNRTINPKSLRLLRDEIEELGFVGDLETAPDYLPNWSAKIVIGFVEKGFGAQAVSVVDQDETLRALVGRKKSLNKVTTINRFIKTVVNNFFVTAVGMLTQSNSYSTFTTKINETIKPALSTQSLNIHEPVLFANEAIEMDVTNMTLSPQEVTVLPLDVAPATAFYNTYAATTSVETWGQAAVDSTGRIAFVGYYDSSNFGGGATTNPYVGVIDSTGDVVWGRNHNFGDSLRELLAVAWDSSDNLYVAGKQSFIGGQNRYVVKFNSSGTELWAKEYEAPDGAGNLNLHSIIADSNGDLICAGSIFRSPNFWDDILVFKVDGSNGSVIWATYLAYNSANTEMTGVKVDSSDNIILAGTTQWQDLRGPGDDGNVGIIAKFNSSGAIQWERRIENTTAGSFTDDMWLSDLTVDSIGDVYVNGSINVSGTIQAYLSKFDSSGNEQFAIRFDRARGSNSGGIAVDEVNSLLYFSAEENAPNPDQAAVICTDLSGTFQWGLQLANLGQGTDVAINTSSDNYVVIAGYNGIAQIDRSGSTFTGATSFTPSTTSPSKTVTSQSGTTGSVTLSVADTGGTTTAETITKTVVTTF